jgi:hypothetical protein
VQHDYDNEFGEEPAGDDGVEDNDPVDDSEGAPDALPEHTEDAEDSEEFEFDSQGDISDDEELDQESAYTRFAKAMPESGVRSAIDQYIHEASVAHRPGPPLSSRAGALSTKAADHNVVPLIVCDHGVHMKPIPFITYLNGLEHLNRALERMGGMYGDGVKYSQWKPGLQLASGIGLSCANISRSNGKYSKDHHERCMEEPCLNQITSTGVCIMQCNTHRQTPTSFNHLSLASYWYNFTSELVATYGSFFSARAKWRAAIKPRQVLLDWLLLSYIYLEQDVNVSQGRPTRFPITANAGSAPQLKSALKAPPAYAAIEADYQGAQSAKKKSGVKVIGDATPTPKKQKQQPSGGKRGNDSATPKGGQGSHKHSKSDSKLSPGQRGQIDGMSESSAKKALAKLMEKVANTPKK